MLYGSYLSAILAYADDLVLLAPTASAMRHMLSLCDEFALEFDVKFNASKSKCIYFTPLGSNSVANSLLCFFIGGSVIKYVDSWPHLGHILHARSGDLDDILNRRSALVRQCNDILCHFSKLSPIVKLSLLYSYCSSLYGYELWSLNSREIDAIGVS